MVQVHAQDMHALGQLTDTVIDAKDAWKSSQTYFSAYHPLTFLWHTPIQDKHLQLLQILFIGLNVSIFALLWKYLSEFFQKLVFRP